MRFDTSQSMKLGQQMKLAPRMIQSMEILQMALPQLEERIEQELESNVTLETFEPGGDAAEIEAERVEHERDARENERELSIDDSTSADDFERLSSMESSYAEAFENQYESGSGSDGGASGDTPASSADRGRELEHGSYSASRMAGERDAKMDAMASTEARPESLAEQLAEQWAFADVPDTEAFPERDVRAAGELLIQFLDDDGYMRTPLAEVAQAGPRDDRGEPRLTVALLERALDELQWTLEPAGLAARDVRECLLLQVDALQLQEMERAAHAQRNGAGATLNGAHAPADDAVGDAAVGDDAAEVGSALEASGEAEPATWADVRTLIADHLDDIVHNRIPQAAKRSGLSVERIKAAMALMRRLSVSPARALVSETPPTITPDAVVEYDEDDDSYFAYLTDGRLPNLRVNREYARMAKDRGLPSADREFLRTNLSNAQWLIDAIRQRQNTLLRVVNAVVSAQREFFEQGAPALKPLPMTQVADQLGVHVATVSRAVAGKHLLTPRGIVPLRSFFTGGTQTDSGEDVSWESIKAAMREVVDGEDKAKPLSDDAIAKALKGKGLNIARRTVAKYRAQLDIPPARMRKRF